MPNEQAKHDDNNVPTLLGTNDTTGFTQRILVDSNGRILVSLGTAPVIEGALIIDTTDTEAFLVRKDADAGDVFSVNTTVPGAYASGSGTLLVSYMLGATSVTPTMSSVTGTNNANTVYATYATSTASPSNRYIKARGTQASPTTVLNNDGVMTVIGDAYNGTSFRSGASMQFQVAPTGTISETSMPMFFRINTAPDGSIAALERFRVTESGAISIGRGEFSTSASTGGIVRAPDTTTGGAGNIAAGDITISGGLGTGTGDPSQVIIQASTPATSGDNLQSRSTILVIDGDTTSAVTITAPSHTSGLPSAFALTPGANTGVTVGSDNPQFQFNTSTQTWATGAVSFASYSKIAGPTFAAAASSTFTIAATLYVDKSPIQGSNATLSNVVALLVGDPLNSITSAVAGANFKAIIVPEGIANGTTTVGSRIGLLVTSPSGQIALGNQTATLTDFYGIKIEGSSLVSTTNTRTVTNAASLYIENAPSNGGNITFTTGPYSLFVDAGLSRFDGGLAIDGSTTQNVASGVYTPTRSAESNMDSNVTMTEAQYMRLGNTVTVSGRFTADPTLTATATSFEITLPVSSNLGAVEDAAGTAFCGAIAGMGAEVIGVVANDTAKIQWIASDVTSKTWSYTFTYQVI